MILNVAITLRKKSCIQIASDLLGMRVLTIVISDSEEFYILVYLGSKSLEISAFVDFTRLT